MFQRIKGIHNKLRDNNVSASEKLYDKALNEINEITEANSCDHVKNIRKHLKRRAEHCITCLKYPQIPMENSHAEQLLKTVIVHRSNGIPLRIEEAMKQYGMLLTV
ncbi:MAG: hypothetical protein ACTSYA_12455 [Candidatus Kariarchaeaceae archaeon]